MMILISLKGKRPGCPFAPLALSKPVNRNAKKETGTERVHYFEEAKRKKKNTYPNTVSPSFTLCVCTLNPFGILLPVFAAA